MSNRVFCRKHDPDGHANWDSGFRPLLDDTCFMCATEQLNQQLQQAHAELAVAKAALEQEERHTTELCQELSRYKQGVEMEATIRVDENEVLLVSDVRDWTIGHGLDIGQRVKVLVRAIEPITMPKEDV